MFSDGKGAGKLSGEGKRKTQYIIIITAWGAGRGDGETGRSSVFPK